MSYILQIVAAPTAQVDSSALPIEHVTKEVASLSLIDMFIQSDLVVKLVILVLLLCSIISWTIIIEKSFSFLRLRNLSRSFEKNFWSGKPLESLLKQVVERKEKHPLAQVFAAAMQEVNAESDAANQHSMKERIDRSMRVAVNRSLEELENYVGFLATIASSAPFIGLFGTVWGIMSSFQSIAISKNTTLAVVAPGIAEALFATAIGLMAAIPAAIFYNKLSTDINKLSNKIENFATELSTLIIRDID